jgi:hypothetical protein
VSELNLCRCCSERCGGGQAAQRENLEPPPIGGDGGQTRPVAPGGGMQTPSVRIGGAPWFVWSLNSLHVLGNEECSGLYAKFTAYSVILVCQKRGG